VGVPHRGPLHPRPELAGVLADSTDFTAAFTKDGPIRPDRSTANDGTARVTLRYGDEPGYDAACDALTTA
jgi:hypothetical protein